MTSELRSRDSERSSDLPSKGEECISYQLPAFQLDGKCFAWFRAAKEHCAIYGVVGTHKDELTDYDVSKGTIRFQADKPLPAALVRKLIQAGSRRTPVAAKSRATSRSTH